MRADCRARAAGKGVGGVRARCAAGRGCGGGRGHELIAVCALHSVPHSPPTACLAARTPCCCPAGMRPPRTMSPRRLGPLSLPSLAAVLPEWAGRIEPGLPSSAAGQGPLAQASRIHAEPHHVRCESVARAGLRREGFPRSLCGIRGMYSHGPWDTAHSWLTAGFWGG